MRYVAFSFGLSVNDFGFTFTVLGLRFQFWVYVFSFGFTFTILKWLIAKLKNLILYGVFWILDLFESKWLYDYKIR